MSDEFIEKGLNMRETTKHYKFDPKKYVNADMWFAVRDGSTMICCSQENFKGCDRSIEIELTIRYLEEVKKNG